MLDQELTAFVQHQALFQRHLTGLDVGEDSLELFECIFKVLRRRLILPSHRRTLYFQTQPHATRPDAGIVARVLGTIWQMIPFVVAVALWMVSPFRSGIERMIQAARESAKISGLRRVIIVFVFAFVTLILPPALRGDAFSPRSHDEQMHLLQARMLSQGTLRLPSHPLGQFFDTFFVINDPVYASVYFPGTSFLFVPSIWLGLPYWLLPVLYSSLAVALIDLILVQLIDGVAGLLGVITLLSITTFREMALVMMSHNIMLMLGLLTFWLWPIVFLVVLGADVIGNAWPSGKTLAVLLVLAGAVSGQPGLNPSSATRWKTPVLDDVNAKLAHLEHTPAVVLFRYHPTSRFDEEPVYNTDVAWPDDAKIVRAHDLGDENRKLVHYYAQHQPQRYFYLYDRADGTLTPLGTASELDRSRP